MTPLLTAVALTLTLAASSPGLAATDADAPEVVEVAHDRLDALAAAPFEDVRLVPVYHQQAYAGFKLVGVRPDSVWRVLGIRSGDVVRAVNGRAIASPAAIEGSFLPALRRSRRVVVDLERRGRPHRLIWKVEGGDRDEVTLPAPPKRSEGARVEAADAADNPMLNQAADAAAGVPTPRRCSICAEVSVLRSRRWLR